MAAVLERLQARGLGYVRVMKYFVRRFGPTGSWLAIGGCAVLCACGSSAGGAPSNDANVSVDAEGDTPSDSPAPDADAEALDAADAADLDAADALPPPPQAVGNVGWALGFAAEPIAIGASAAGDVYVAAHASTASAISIGGLTATPVGSGPGFSFVVKLTSAGTPVWVRTWAGLLYDLAIDDAGSVFLVGDHAQAESFDGVQLGYGRAMLVLDPAGHGQLGVVVPNVTYLSSVAVGRQASGEPLIVLGGETGSGVPCGTVSPSRGGFDGFVAIYDGTLTCKRTITFGGVADDWVRNVAVRPGGDVLAAGDFVSNSIDFGAGARPNSGSKSGGYAVSYALDGTHRWDHVYTASGAACTVRVAAAPSGGAVIAGFFEGALAIDGVSSASTNGEAALFQALDVAGTKSALRTFATTGGSLEHAGFEVLAVDRWGEVLVGGTFAYQLDLGAGPIVGASNVDAFFAKLSATGTGAWGRGFGSSKYDSVYGVAVDGSGRVYGVGYHGASMTIGGTSMPGTTGAFVVGMAP